MAIHFVPEIAERVHYVGVRDPDRRMFDALVPLPQGTTYNSYLVKGEKKTALIDTVNPGFETEFKERISMVSSVEEIDYVVMNHAEPDHASAISYVFGKNSKAKLLVNKRGADAAKLYFNIPEDRIRVVTDGEKVDLGGKTLRFIVAPMLHWPETMFTYLEEDGVLFSCDFFALHTAYGFYDDQIPEMIQYAQRYFGEIMMPYKSMGKRALDKIRDLEINVIAPSHGPIHRNPDRIMDVHEKWTVGETKDKVIVVYATMWKSTEKMINQLAAVLKGRGIETPVYNLEQADIGEIAKDLVDARGIVLGTPTVVGRMHPLAVYGAHLVSILRPPAKYGVVLTSYGWGKGALAHASEMLGPAGLEIVGAMEVNGPPSPDDYAEIRAIAERLADKVLSG
jgi:flavorubredoxin